jgi:predicted lactoylglutathione lyase
MPSGRPIDISEIEAQRSALLNSFYDLDGDHWEVLWMDPGFVQK